MLNKVIGTLIITSLWLLNPATSSAVEHPAGHGGGNSGSSGCPRVGVRKMEPAPLTEVAPGSAFSAIVFGAKDPEHIEVTVKKMPVAVKIDTKDDFYVVSGQFPAELQTTAARINIKVVGLSAKCSEENGWLVKIK